MSDERKHCVTCSCFGADPKVVGYCDSEVTRLHETFGCLEATGHRSDHEGAGYHSACPNCGGLDLHSDECPTPDLLEDTSQPFVAVRWNHGGTLLTWFHSGIVGWVRSVETPKEEGTQP